MTRAQSSRHPPSNSLDFSPSFLPPSTHRMLRTLTRTTLPLLTSKRTFTMSLPALTKTRNSTEPPKHKMVYFPNMTQSLPSETADFRTVLWTGQYSQVVLMTIPPGGDIGEETHTVDQALTFTSGIGKATVGGEEQAVKAGDLVIVPAGTLHQFENTGATPLILYTIYSPAEHNPNTVHKTKEEADKHEDDGTDESPAWARKSVAENEAASKK